MNHSEQLKTFPEIQNHLEMEEERLKTFSSSNALVAKGNCPRSNMNRGRVYKKAHFPIKRMDLRLVLLRSRRQKAMVRKI